MIKVQNLTRRYQDLIALNQVSFSIEPNEVVGLLGHNGAGKTTAMKMLSGYLAPCDGTIEIDGHRLPEAAHFLQSQLGYLPEVLPVYPDMTVIDYLDYIAVMRNIAKSDKPRAVARAIEATDLNVKALKPIATLSRGYKQRVGVASAIIHQPKILILDEPTNGLDPEQTQHMRELICRLAKSATVLLSTHIMQEVEAICTRVLILQNGRLVIDESLAKLRETRQVTLATSADEDKITQLLKGKPQIANILVEAKTQQNNQFTLDIDSQAPMQTVVSETARLLIEEGVEIFTIAPKKHNLEGIVRGIQQGETKRVG